MRWLLLLFESLCLFIFFIIVLNMDMAKYLYFQANGQLKIIVEAEPIEKAIAGNIYTEKEKKALRLIQSIKQFSVDTFGFKSIENYTSVYNQGNKPILWITTACQPFSFEAYNWEFPYLGKVAYKGFFYKTKAEAELERLKSMGLDADLGTVSGWSTLGWLPEPVLSNWLKREDAELANLIFHELFHGTVYVKNEVDLNENLASFIADKATMYFLNTDSLKRSKYFLESKDEKLINDYALNYKLILKNAYNRWNKLELPNTIMNDKKDSILRSFVTNVKGLKLHDTSFIQRYLKNSLKAKNAFFMHFERYDSKYDSLNQVFQQKFNGNLKSYINYLKINTQSL